MSQMLQRGARKVLSKGVLITLIVFAALGAVGSVIYGALAQTALTTGISSIEVPVLGNEKLAPTLQLPNGYDVQSATARIDVPLDAPSGLPLQAVATLLPFVVCGMTCLVVIFLAAQMLRKRNFGLGAAWAMFVAGAVSLASGIAIPWLESAAQKAFVASAGLATSGEMVQNTGFPPRSPTGPIVIGRLSCSVC